MSTVDGWVLEGCSGAVGPFPHCMDWMDRSASRWRPVMTKPAPGDVDRTGVIRVARPARRGGSPAALRADAVMVFLSPYRFWWWRRCRVGCPAGRGVHGAAAAGPFR